MPGVLQTSRIPVLLVPVPVIASVIQQQGVVLDPAVLRDLPLLLAFLRGAPGGPILQVAAQVWLTRAPQWRTATFTMQKQRKGRWCWAAVTASVAAAYDPGTPWTQCEVADKELNRSDCCPDGPACDEDHELSPALTRAAVLRTWSAGQATFGELANEIDTAAPQGRPVGWRILWNGGGGHFAVIYAYALDAGVQWLAVADPAEGEPEHTLDMAQLAAGQYRGGGTWTHTYFTQP